jgi:predicted nucleic acid-binding protein
VEDEAAVGDAIRYYKQGLDFADALHVASSAQSERMLTFDRRFAARSRRTATMPKVAIAGE